MAFENKERRVISSIILMYAIFVTKSIASLLVLLIMRRVLVETSFGIWVLLQSIGSYLFIFDSGLTQIVMNLTGAAYSNEKLEDISKITFNSLVMFLSMSFCISIFSLIAIYFFHADHFLVRDYVVVRHILPACLMFFIPLTMFRFPLRIFSAVLNGLRSLHLRLLVDLLHPLVFLGVIVVTVLFTDNLLTIVITSTTSILIVFSLFLPLMLYKYPFIKLMAKYFDLNFCKTTLVKMLKYAPLPLCLLGQRMMPVFLLSALDGLTLVPGLYLAITVYRLLIFFISDSISKGFQPYIIHFHTIGNISAINSLWKLSTKVTTLVCIILITFSFSWYGTFAKLILGKDSLIIPSLIVIYAILCLVDSMLSTGGNNFIAMNKYGKLSGLWLLEAAVGMGLGIIGGLQNFMPHILGISLGFLIAKLLVSLLGHIFLFSKFMKISFFSMMWQMLGGRMLVALALLCVSLCLTHYAMSRLTVATNILYSFGTCAVLCFLFWTYNFSANEKNWLKERVVGFLDVRGK